MDFSQLNINTPLEILNKYSKESMVGNLGIQFTKVAEGLVEGEMKLSDKNSRPGGILHGGANLAFAETLAGLGSMLIVDFSKFEVLGIQVNGNHTGVLKNGKALAKATIVHRGKQTHVWNVDVNDDAGRLISTARVTNMIVKRENDL